MHGQHCVETSGSRSSVERRGLLDCSGVNQTALLRSGEHVHVQEIMQSQTVNSFVNGPSPVPSAPAPSAPAPSAPAPSPALALLSSRGPPLVTKTDCIIH